MDLVEKIKNNYSQGVIYTVIIVLILLFFSFLLNGQYNSQSEDVRKSYTAEEKLDILESLKSDATEKSKQEKLDILNNIPNNNNINLTTEEKLEIMNSLEENN